MSERSFDDAVVVIPTRDRPAFLESCLAALEHDAVPPDRIVVVDSASKDPKVRAVAGAHGVTLVREDEPGTSKARNAGIKVAGAGLIVFVDDDVRVVPGWADAMLGAFEDDEVTFVTGRLSAPAHQLDGQRPIALKDEADAVRIDHTTPAPLGASANLGVRRAALEAVGGFDERLGGGVRFCAAEDLDLFDRLLAAGYTGRYEPAARAEHEQWRDRRAALRVEFRYGVGLGARLTKLVRTDRTRARLAASEVFWSDGLVPLGRGLRSRHEFEIAAAALRLLGTLIGLAGGIVVPLRDRKFR